MMPGLWMASRETVRAGVAADAPGRGAIEPAINGFTKP